MAVPRLKEQYEKQIVPELAKELGEDNVMALPRLDRIVLNMGLGEAVANPKILEGAVEELSAIAGQRAVVTKAKKSIATYKLRTGMPIGARVTLRGRRMYDFLDRLINIALPRVRDFRGVSAKAFDGRGNYTLGVRDHFIFPDGRRFVLDLGEMYEGLAAGTISALEAELALETLAWIDESAGRGTYPQPNGLGHRPDPALLRDLPHAQE